MIEVEDRHQREQLDRQLAWLMRSRGMVVTKCCHGYLDLTCKQDLTGACQPGGTLVKLQSRTFVSGSSELHMETIHDRDGLFLSWVNLKIFSRSTFFPQDVKGLSYR